MAQPADMGDDASAPQYLTAGGVSVSNKPANRHMVTAHEMPQQTAIPSDSPLTWGAVIDAPAAPESPTAWGAIPDEQMPPPVNWQDRVQAHQAGFFRGASYLAGLVPDIAVNAFNLNRAVAGTAYGLTHTTEQTSPLRTPQGLYHFLDPKGVETFSKNAPPAGSKPVTSTHTDIPSADQFSTDVSPVGGWIAKQLDKFHDYTPTTPDRPDDTASRYIGAVSSAIPAAAAGAGLNAAGGTSTQMLARALLSTGRSTVAAALPISAGQAVAEAQPFGNDKPYSTAGNNAAAIAAQLLTGQVQPMASAAVRGLIRGGEAGRQQMLENTQSFRDAGAEPSVGQASGTRRMQFLESGLSKLPGGAGVMARAAADQAGDIGAGVEDLTSGLSPRGVSPERAGRAIEEGITGEGGFRDQFRDTASQLYGRLEQHIAPDRAVDVGNTLSTLDDLSKPTPGAPATSALLANPRVRAIREALLSDVGENGTLPFSALSRLRSQVGGMLSGNELIADIPKAQIKQLYGSISADMETAANQAGPQASQAFSRANNYYRAGLDRLDTLSDVVNRGGPESMFNAAMSGTKDGATRLRAMMRSLEPAEQKTVAATVLKRMGTANAGAQDATGDVFSPNTFLTNYNKMSPEAKTALFDRLPGDTRATIDNIASVASNLREGSKVFNNPSGTAGASHQVGDLMKVLGAAGVAWHEVGGWKAPAAVVASAAGANALARAMTNPNVVDWAGRRTDMFGPGNRAALIAAPGNLSANDRNRLLIQALMQGGKQ
jgi:hypothetical protein